MDISRLLYRHYRRKLSEVNGALQSWMALNGEWEHFVDLLSERMRSRDFNVMVWALLPRHSRESASPPSGGSDAVGQLQVI